MVTFEVRVILFERLPRTYRVRSHLEVRLALTICKARVGGPGRRVMSSGTRDLPHEKPRLGTGVQRDPLESLNPLVLRIIGPVKTSQFVGPGSRSVAPHLETSPLKKEFWPNSPLTP